MNRVIAAMLALVASTTLTHAAYKDVTEAELNAAASAWMKCMASKNGDYIGRNVGKTGKKGKFGDSFSAAEAACDKTKAMERVRIKSEDDWEFRTWYYTLWAITRSKLYKLYQSIKAPE